MRNEVDHGDKMLGEHKKNFREIWGYLKRPNFNLIEIDKGLEVQMKEMNSIFKEIISKKFFKS